MRSLPKAICLAEKMGEGLGKCPLLFGPVPTGALAFLVEWCRLQDSNPWPPDYKSGALPTELSRHAERPLASNNAKGPALSSRNVRIQGFRRPKGRISGVLA